MPGNSASNTTAVIALLFLAMLTPSTTAQSLPEPPAAATELDYDQVTAYIPQAPGEIAAVALARLVIALHDARGRAASKFCSGNRAPSGAAVQQTMDRLPDQKIWFYRSLRQPLPLACGPVSREQFFLEMSRHLPLWVSLRPAGQNTTFSQGAMIEPLPQSRFVNR
jgi:hypothetical protein